MGHGYIWTAVVKENWSAFAPGFEELEENIEYEEREDEYDNVSYFLNQSIVKKAKDVSCIHWFKYPGKENDFKPSVRDEDVDIEHMDEVDRAEGHFRFAPIPNTALTELWLKSSSNITWLQYMFGVSFSRFEETFLVE